ncbi:MAG: tetratricopeptide repeat protein, partial [Nocardioides sp.]
DLLRKSLDILEELGDEFSQSQVLHTLGQLVGRDRKRAAEAEDLLQTSLHIKSRLSDEFGQAQVLHTLGQLVGRDRKRAAEAEDLLQKSLQIGENLSKRNHVAQVFRSLGKLVAGTDRARAIYYLEQSLHVNKEIGNKSGQSIVQKVLNTLVE